MNQRNQLAKPMGQRTENSPCDEAAVRVWLGEEMICMDSQNLMIILDYLVVEVMGIVMF